MDELMKRPLVWILAFYLAGMAAFSLRLVIVILIAVGILLFELLWSLIRGLILKGKLKNYWFIFSLPFLFLLGYFLMNRQLEPNSMDKTFLAEAEAEAVGELISITEKGDYCVLTLKKVSVVLEESGKYKDNQINVYTYGEDNYKIGNSLWVKGTIKKFQRASNPGQFNEYQYYKMLGIDYKMTADSIQILNSNYSKFFQTLRSIKLKFMQVYKGILPEKNAGILTAMMLGDTSYLDTEIKELYKESGISHILVISGVHISLLGITLYELLRRLRVPIILNALLSIFIIFSYGVLTNFGVSTNRAVVMLILLIGANVIGRTYDILSATALSALIILVQSPLQITNAGFLLSFGAIIGIAVIYPILSKLIPVKNSIIDGLIVSFGIQLVTLPVILYYFYEFPTYSLLINMIILPTSSIIILLAILGGFAGCISFTLGKFVIGSVHYLLNFYEAVCRMAKELPGRTFLVGRPYTLLILAYLTILILFVLVNQKKKRRISLGLLLFLNIILIKPEIVAFKVTFLNVGQGDGIFMQAKSGTTYFIDGGSTDVSKVGQYRIEPFLKSNGVAAIDYAVMTHADNDHISGLKELIAGMAEEKLEKEIMNWRKDLYDGTIQIKHLVLPDISVKDEAYLELVSLAESRGIPILYIKKGDRITDGILTITCLHPSKDYTFSSRNAYSTVLSVTYGKFDLLLTGDLEEDGELLLDETLKNMVSSDYDVLKVAHHGSKNSSYETFLKIVKPEYAIISCGFDNSYGHPHEETLNRLKEVKSDILITYESGAITIETDGKNMKVKEYLNKN